MPNLRPLISLLAVPAILAAAPARQAPHAAWRTIRTEHYRIHYPPPLADWAQDVASRVEGIHAAVTQAVGHAASKPVQVILLDPREEANGMAISLIPQPRVILWRTEPWSDSFMDTMSDWAELLTVHEFAHIHHLTRPQNQANRLERLLPIGPLARKAPRWLVEGYATLLEGRLTGSGRPHSVTRSVLLRQWSMQGRLPVYDALDGFQGFRGGNMAYLVGSAYLEWLERQRPQTPDILQRLWKQMASRKRRDFQTSFSATFGFAPQEGYARFRAELAHDALEWEQRAKAQGLQEGELWLRTDGAVGDLALSPDGQRLLAYLGNEKDPGLRVWDLKGEEKKAPESKLAEASDPQEVEDVAPEAPPVKLHRRLPRLRFQVPDRPEWIDDRTVKFMLKRADEEGVLKRLPALWHLEGGVELHPSTVPAPRWSFLQPVHRQGRWVLEVKGREVPLPGQAAGRAVLDDARGLLYAACEWEGTWNLVKVPVTAEGFGEVQRLTRTSSAVWNPAPSPDGKTLFFTRLDARGVEIRRLELGGDALPEAPAPVVSILTTGAILKFPAEPGTLPPPGPVPPSEPYRAAEHLLHTPLLLETDGPSGSSTLFGLGGQDPLERFSWSALVAAGSDGGPSGAVASFASRAWAWSPSMTVFLAREKPSHQRLKQHQGRDRERRGAELAFTYENLSDAPWWISPVIAWERNESLDERTLVENRGLVGLRLGAGRLWARGPWGLALNLDGQAYVNRGTEWWGSSRARLALALFNPHAPLRLRFEGGRVASGAAERFELGGFHTALVPASLDMARVEQGALPLGMGSGTRFLRYRAELGDQLRIYLEGNTLWDQARGPYQRVAGLELHLEDLLNPSRADRALHKVDLRLGAHRILDGPLKKHESITVSVVIRP